MLHWQHLAVQHALLELRQLGGDPALWVDQHGHAVIGRADHPAAGFEGAHLRHLQVLQGADGAAEPGVVAHRQEDVAARRQAGSKLRVHHLVADKTGDAVALGLQQRLLGRAAGEIGHRQVEEGDQAAQQVLQRDIFTKGHQLLLEVGALALADGGDGVVVAFFAALVQLAHRHAGYQRAVAAAGEGAHGGQVVVGVFLEYRHGGFRPDQQIRRLGAVAEVAVQIQLGAQLGRVPLQVLGDIALHQGHAQWLAGSLGPGVAVQGQAGQPGADQQDQGRRQKDRTRAQTRQVDQQGGAQGQDEGDQPHAAHRRQAAEGAVELAVAGVQPGETGEEPTAEGLQHQPQGGEGQGVGQGRFAAAQPARPQPGREAEEEGDGGAESQGQAGGQRSRGAAMVVDADVDPAGAGDKQGQAVAPAAPQRRLGREVTQAEVEQPQRQQGQGPDVERGEHQWSQSAGQQGQQIARPAGASDPVHRGSGQW